MHTNLSPRTAARVSPMPPRPSPLPPPAVAADALQIDLAGLIHLLGGDSDVLLPADDLRFGVQRAARGTMLVHEGAPAGTLYVVQAGSFKIVRTAEDGYEHVLAFAWRGDVIGFDGLACGRYAFAAEARGSARMTVPITFQTWRGELTRSSEQEALVASATTDVARRRLISE